MSKRRMQISTGSLDLLTPSVRPLGSIKSEILPGLETVEDFQSFIYFREFLSKGAKAEINIDGKTMEETRLAMKSPTR